MTKNEFAAKLGNDVNVEALMAEIEKAEDDNAVLEILKHYNVEFTPEEIRSLYNQEEELDEAALDDVAGGCKCKGILKRAFTNFLSWVFKTATGTTRKCPECNH